VCVCAADYLTDTQEVKNLIALFRKTDPHAPATFVVTGLASSLAKHTLEAVRIQLAQNGKVAW
jgi:hypothetical protein